MGRKRAYKEIVIRVPDVVVKEIDKYIESGAFVSRSQVARFALTKFLERTK